MAARYPPASRTKCGWGRAGRPGAPSHASTYSFASFTGRWERTRTGAGAFSPAAARLAEVRVKKIMALAASGAALLLLGSAAPSGMRAGSGQPAGADGLNATAATPADPFAAPADLAWAPEPPPPPPAPTPPPPPPEPPTPSQGLADGVLIVVSIPSQRLYVFRDGDLWDSSKVSTGKRGHETPTGTFPILQKKVEHRSTLYDDAPMPFMQRLTWGGVALHAGRVPGYPASHGCIRLPRAFAKKLYAVTRASTTAVIVTAAPLASAKAALAEI